MSYIVVVPLKRRKPIEVFTTHPDDLWDLYAAIQLVTADDTRVTIARVAEGDLGKWMANNVEPTWFERIRGRIKFAINTMDRGA